MLPLRPLFLIQIVARFSSRLSRYKHYPDACRACGSALSGAMSTGYGARQVFDLPEPLPLAVTEHRAHTCRCGHCGRRTLADFPDGVTAPVQYGPRIAAVVVYLLHYQLLPEDRLAEAMADLFGWWPRPSPG